MPNIKSFSAVALFCEDVRDEANGMKSIIGTFQDNIAVPGFPGQMPRLGIFMRANFPFSQMPKEISFRLDTSWKMAPISLGSMDKQAIEKAFKDSKLHDGQFVGVIMTAVIAPFPVMNAGRVDAVLIVDGKEYVVGYLNFVIRAGDAKKPSTGKNSARKLKKTTK